jgi:hypothetical protein
VLFAAARIDRILQLLHAGIAQGLCGTGQAAIGWASAEMLTPAQFGVPGVPANRLGGMKPLPET